MNVSFKNVLVILITLSVRLVSSHLLKDLVECTLDKHPSKALLPSKGLILGGEIRAGLHPEIPAPRPDPSGPPGTSRGGPGGALGRRGLRAQCGTGDSPAQPRRGRGHRRGPRPPRGTRTGAEDGSPGSRVVCR